MSDVKLARSMIFKGGFVCVQVYESPRYTIDLNSVLHECSLEQAQKLIPETMQQDLCDGWSTTITIPFQRQLQFPG